MKNWINKNIFSFCLASFFSDWCHEMTTAILPEFIAQIVGAVYAPFLLGIVQGLSDASATIMKLFAGLLADRVAFYRPFLIIGYGLTGICIPLIGTAKTILMILFYKTIAWAARGMREPIRDTWISKIVPTQFYGRVFGIHRAWDTLGALVGPLFAFFLLQLNFSLQSIFFLALIPGLVSVLPIIFLTHEEKKETLLGSHVVFLQQIKNMPSRFVSFLWIMFLFGIGNCNQALLIYRVQALLGQTNSLIIATTAGVLLYSFFNIIRAASEFGMGTLSDYVNRKMLLAVFGFGFFGITSIGFMLNTTCVWVWLILFGCAGLSAGTVKALEKAHAAYILPEHIRGTGLGILQAADGVGDLISSAIVGALWSGIGPSAGFLYAAIVSFMAMVLLILKK